MTTVEQLAQQALALAPAERAHLADVLEQSLTTGGFATAELAEAWAAEIDRRLEARGRGEGQSIDADVALRRIQQRLTEHRARRVAS
jgi:putative addiction module component (TIGR02574 family)